MNEQMPFNSISDWIQYCETLAGKWSHIRLYSLPYLWVQGC